MIAVLSIWKGISFYMVKNEQIVSVSQWLSLNKESFKSLTGLALRDLLSFFYVSAKKIGV